MAEQLLTKADIGKMLATSPNIAASLLIKAGCHPIDFGAGRRHGYRWFESAVIAAIRKMHMEAQPAPARPRKQSAPKGDLNLASMNAKELDAILRQREPLTACDTLQ